MHDQAVQSLSSGKKSVYAAGKYTSKVNCSSDGGKNADIIWQCLGKLL